MLVCVQLEVQRLLTLVESRHNVVWEFSVLSGHHFAVLARELFCEARSVHWHSLCLEHWQVLFLNALWVVVVKLALAFWVIFRVVLVRLTLLTHEDNLGCVDDVLVDHLLLVFPFVLVNHFVHLSSHVFLHLRGFLELTLFEARVLTWSGLFLNFRFFSNDRLWLEVVRVDGFDLLIACDCC